MLTLPIKGKYFKMIESGEKPEEYRNRPPHNTFTERLRRYVPDTGSSLYS